MSYDQILCYSALLSTDREKTLGVLEQVLLTVVAIVVMHNENMKMKVIERCVLQQEWYLYTMDHGWVVVKMNLSFYHLLIA